MMPKRRPQIVFVCTGNIFRSLSAEFGMRAADTGNDWTFASAGTHTREGRRLRTDVLDANAAHGVDAGGHYSRVLTAGIAEQADLLIAMDRDHQRFIREKFNRHAPLFLEVSRGLKEGVPDLPDIVPDYQNNPEAARIYVAQAVDFIMAERPAFLRNLPHFLPKIAPGPAAPRP